MKIEFKDCKVERDVLDFVAKVSAKFSEIEALDGGSYPGNRFMEQIRNTIAEKLADEFLAEKKSELVDQLDINKIINGINIKLIEGFTLNR